MNYAVAYYTRSGNTKKVADAIAEVIGVPTTDISKGLSADVLPMIRVWKNSFRRMPPRLSRSFPSPLPHPAIPLRNSSRQRQKQTASLFIRRLLNAAANSVS